MATLAGLLEVLGERLEVTARAAELEGDRGHFEDLLARSPSERLELAIGWNRLAGELALAGREARRRA